MKKRVTKTPTEATLIKKRTASQELTRDRLHAKRKMELASVKKKYNASLKEIRNLENQNVIADLLKDTVSTTIIKPNLSNRESEATAVWVASDWHVEENVRANEVNGLNRYTLAIAKKRARSYFRNGLRLTNLFAKDVHIDTIVLALLGDFITNYIHDELAEITETEPIHAVIYAQNLIASGIEYILANSDYKLVIPCQVGNHGRTTAKMHSARSNGHSLEYYMYVFLKEHFSSNDRVQFILNDSTFTYVKIYGYRIRFLHGHTIRYLGGVGGLTIPANKKIAQWDKSNQAYLTVFGHFHQFFDGGNFICNGSMIGYNAYALANGYSFEPPRQAMFLIDKKRGKTIVCPILFE